GDQAGDQAPAAQSPVAVGEQIIQPEIAGHRDDRGDRLAIGNVIARICVPNHSVSKWVPTPRPPIIENSRKRTGTAGPTSFCSSSIRYSHATIVSSLLSPCSRWRKVSGTSAKLSGRGEEANKSRRILKPWPDSERIAAVKALRSTMKYPLIGSVKSALTTSRPSRPATSLMTTRERCHSPTLPASV